MLGFWNDGDISLKLVDKFTYLGSSVSSTEKDIDTRLTKAWTAIDKLSVIWKSDLTDKMKRSFFQTAVVSVLLYGCTTWTLTKQMQKKLDGNYTRMLRAILNKSWRQHPTKQQLYGHLLPITKTIQVRRTIHAGHCWRSRDELISDVLLWTPSYGRAKAGRPARTCTTWWWWWWWGISTLTSLLSRLRNGYLNDNVQFKRPWIELDESPQPTLLRSMGSLWFIHFKFFDRCQTLDAELFSQ